VLELCVSSVKSSCSRSRDFLTHSFSETFGISKSTFFDCFSKSSASLIWHRVLHSRICFRWIEFANTLWIQQQISGKLFDWFYPLKIARSLIVLRATLFISRSIVFLPLFRCLFQTSLEAVAIGCLDNRNQRDGKCYVTYFDFSPSMTIFTLLACDATHENKQSL
jgi:hypothetical protein